MLWSDLCCNTEKCSEILAHIELLYNPRVNKVFTHSLEIVESGPKNFDTSFWLKAGHICQLVILQDFHRRSLMTFITPTLF